MKPLAFKIEYTASQGSWNSAKPVYTVKILAGNDETRAALGVRRHEDLAGEEVGIQFRDWSAMQSWVAQRIGKACERFALRELPGRPKTRSRDGAQSFSGTILLRVRDKVK